MELLGTASLSLLSSAVLVGVNEAASAKAPSGCSGRADGHRPVREDSRATPTHTLRIHFTLRHPLCMTGVQVLDGMNSPTPHTSAHPAMIHRHDSAVQLTPHRHHHFALAHHHRCLSLPRSSFPSSPWVAAPPAQMTGRPLSLLHLFSM